MPVIQPVAGSVDQHSPIASVLAIMAGIPTACIWTGSLVTHKAGAARQQQQKYMCPGYKLKHGDHKKICCQYAAAQIIAYAGLVLMRKNGAVLGKYLTVQAVLHMGGDCSTAFVHVDVPDTWINQRPSCQVE